MTFARTTPLQLSTNDLIGLAIVGLVLLLLALLIRSRPFASVQVGPLVGFRLYMGDSPDTQPPAKRGRPGIR
jgi:hypothetical protein